MTKNLSILSEELGALAELGGRSVVRVETPRRVAASGIIWSDDGTIVTSHQGLHRAESVRVGMPDGSILPATLEGRDPSTDLALLRVNASGLFRRRLDPAPASEAAEREYRESRALTKI